MRSKRERERESAQAGLCDRNDRGSEFTRSLREYSTETKREKKDTPGERRGARGEEERGKGAGKQYPVKSERSCTPVQGGKLSLGYPNWDF